MAATKESLRYFLMVCKAAKTRRLHRYFHRIGSRKWVFAVKNGGDQGSAGEWVKLAKAADTKIRRHVKVKADANPYDPEWRSYFEDRKRSTPGLDRGLERLEPNAG